MPGFSLAYGSSGAAASGTLFDDGTCRIEALETLRDPLVRQENDDAFALIDGRVYGASDQSLLAETLQAPSDTAAWAKRLQERDGEFIALLYEKRTRRLHLVPDALGRLPFYVRVLDGVVRAAREPSRVIAGQPVTPDSLGLAQLLLFGFAIGTRTLAQGVSVPPAGSRLIVDADGHRFVPSDWPLDLEHQERRPVGLREAGRELADRFVHACEARARATGPIVVALSGGLDSRAVAAALARARLPFRAFTYVDPRGVYAHEATVARRVSEIVGAPWTLFTPPTPRGRSLARLLDWKLGLNALGMAGSLDLLEAVSQAYGPDLGLWTGEGGDKVLPDLRAPIRGSTDAVVSYLLDKQAIWTPEEVARLTGVSRADLAASVAEVIESYPERSAPYRVARFLFSERGRRWLYEGEDRNRHQVWTVAPFYARDFVRRALAVPDAHKAGYGLYRFFLRSLHRGVTGVPDANLGVAPDALHYVLLRRLREASRRFPSFVRWLKKRGAARREAADEPRRRLLDRLAAQSPSVRAAFSPEALRAAEASSPAALDLLFTAACAVEEMVEGKSALDEWAEEVF